MGTDSRQHFETPTHPAEGECIALQYSVAGSQEVIDCSALAATGKMVTIFNLTNSQLGYKFSDNPVASISITATSGPTACQRMPALSVTEPAFIPANKPYLHVQSPITGWVYIATGSAVR